VSCKLIKLIIATSEVFSFLNAKNVGLSISIWVEVTVKTSNDELINTETL